MNAAELTAALDTVEQDHRLVLERVQALKDAVSGLLEPGDPRPSLVRLRDSNKYFATHFLAHLEEEEKTLFPLLARYRPGGPELVARLRREHAEIRQRREELASCLEVALGLEDGLPRMVLRDLVVYGWDLWELLDNHAHAETRAVRQCIALSATHETAANQGHFSLIPTRFASKLLGTRGLAVVRPSRKG